ncbi:MAG TPA: tetratricopeptide repeat protein [Terriglobia bacterium]|nr:tetratricopeptide repeat protein [Terriglobia bacterium]
MPTHLKLTRCPRLLRVRDQTSDYATLPGASQGMGICVPMQVLDTRGILGKLALAALSVSLVVPSGAASAAQQDPLAEARLAEQKHDFQAAATFYQDYLKTHPASADVLQRLGLVEYLSNHFEEAIPTLTRALQLDPSLWGSELYLGMSYYRTDGFQEAIPILKRALALKPGVAETAFWLGCSLLADHQPEAAIPYLLEVQPDATWGEQAQSTLIKAYRQAAENNYQRIAVVAPDSDRVHLVKAQLLQWKGINNGAVWEARQSLQRNPTLEGAHRIIGEVYWQEKGFDLAAKEFQAELEINPLDGESNLRLGEFRLARGDASKAVAYLNTALAQHAGSPGETHHFLGEAALAERDYPAALAHLQSAVEENPGDRANHQLLAQVYRATGQAGLAVSEEKLAHGPQ